MIRDARALDTGAVPRRLVHRDGEIEALTTALRPLESGGEPDGARIFGPTGAGKTTLAKFVLEQLTQEVLDIDWAYVDCLADSTQAAIYHQICSTLGCAADLAHGSTPIQTYQDRLRDHEAPTVVILDEAAHVADPTLFRVLHDMPGVSIIVVSHTEDHLFARTSQATASRLRTGERIHLPTYHDDELIDILQDRIDVGLRTGAVTDEAVETIADSAAGNAREAIAILRRAVKHVQDHDDRERITPPVVATVADEARDVLRRHNLSRLDTPHRIVYDVIRTIGPCGASEISAEYERRTGTSLADRTRRRYVGTLVDYGLVRRSGAGRGTSYAAIEEYDVESATTSA